ncbi:ankyrin repeat domain-containing protein [Chryseobacterium sp. 09-1422]|uniref:Ankyrin repeat domain-containing protein n=1 Tax=Chryseobacterium kimseyorum TaxID=2984028 RepID=A0ABT3HY58_9FLAO|nr:ankyrin repeat domain-containing protein [Chryseobacterium kimseyorum]MCW3168739.1 ankyrin repeat domain-containing protein [Chryseobacterium kimseyorum]
MKKLFLTASILAFSFFSAQELTSEHKQMLKYDDISNFSALVNKENINQCFQNENTSYSLLALSIKLNSKKVFQKLTEEKADLEKVCDGKTPLMFAAKYGNFDFAKKLLEKGAKKETKTDRGYSAIDYAKKYEKTDIIKLLE